MITTPQAPALEVRNLSKRFGAVHALENVSLRIERGDLCGLIGPNGSGKSTLFDCCTGLTSPDRGEIRLDGIDVTRWNQHEIALRGGLRRSFQRNVVLGSMTVEENLLLAGQAQALPSIVRSFVGLRSVRRAMSGIAERVDEMLDLVELQHVRYNLAGELSVGQQKLLQFGAALMPRPKIVLLDEPFAGVNPVLIERLTESIRWANGTLGATILLIEHNIEELFSLCQRIVVMNAGELIADGPPESVSEDETVVRAYLGV